MSGFFEEGKAVVSNALPNGTGFDAISRCDARCEMQDAFGCESKDRAQWMPLMDEEEAEKRSSKVGRKGRFAISAFVVY